MRMLRAQSRALVPASRAFFLLLFASSLACASGCAMCLLGGLGSKKRSGIAPSLW